MPEATQIETAINKSLTVENSNGLLVYFTFEFQWIVSDRAQSVRRELGTLEAAYGKLQRETSLTFTGRSLPTNMARSTVGCE